MIALVIMTMKTPKDKFLFEGFSTFKGSKPLNLCHSPIVLIQSLKYILLLTIITYHLHTNERIRISKFAAL